MKKLLLVPTTLITAFLAFAFVAPAAAGSAIRVVAPVVQAAVPAALVAGNASTSTNARSTQSAGSNEAGPLFGNSNTTSQSHIDRSHEVATSGHPNCGRFGNGFHGGKHNFVCPNEHFPPAS